MINDHANAAWTAAVAADVDVLERPGLDDVLVAIRRARSRLDAVEMRVSRRLRYLAEQGRSEAPERAIANTTGQSQRDANDVAARDQLCNEHPELEDALDTGDLTAAHLDAIHNAARRLDPDVRDIYLSHTDDLMARANKISLDAFQRECRDLAKHCLAQSRRDPDVDELDEQRKASRVSRWTDKATGMHHTKIELDPVRDAKLSAAINRALARLRANDTNKQTPWQQLMVDATLAVLTGDAPTPTDAPEAPGAVVDRVPEITVVFDYNALLANLIAGGVCETENGIPLPATTVRRLCCDAEIIPTIMNGSSTVLDQGRSKRTATRDQRRALRAMYRTCAHPDCHVGFDACRIHHIKHWLEHHGATDLANLLPLCERHHHMVHDGNWTLTLDDQRIATWIRPDGTHHHTDLTTNRVSTITTSAAATSPEIRCEPQLTML